MYAAKFSYSLEISSLPSNLMAPCDSTYHLRVQIPLVIYYYLYNNTQRHRIMTVADTQFVRHTPTYLFHLAYELPRANCKQFLNSLDVTSKKV